MFNSIGGAQWGSGLVIGNKNYSSWSLRPWMAMKVAGLTFEEQVVSLDDLNLKKTVTQISPAGQVPALKDGNVRVWKLWRSSNISTKNFPPPSYGRPSGPPAPARSRPKCTQDLWRCDVNAP
jgi:glutathione S-transferase